MALGEDDVVVVLEELYQRFDSRHHDLADVFAKHADRIDDYVTSTMSPSRRQLLGAAFTHEYSLEGVSVCNPSIVAHPNQDGVELGGLRVVLSYRAIGEGHYSSICFRSGEINSSGKLAIDDPQLFPIVAAVGPGQLQRDVFHAKLHDVGLDGETAASVLDSLGTRFSPADLEAALTKLLAQSDTRLNVVETVALLRSVAECFYTATFDESTDLSRRVLWPSTFSESRGVEDARFVQFDDEGVKRYLASYTAFDGRDVTQQLLQTTDFVTFTSSPLAGIGAKNKGLAIFPRRIGGRFMALSRHDRESNAIASSNSLLRWPEVSTAQMPQQPWELLQLGNCGSPIELDEGWLVITHGVGPMRTYGIGALLLDLDDPTKVLAQLPKPLLLPDIDEQDGYVPNVVYSCGSLVHDGTLYMPYGIADREISFVTVDIAELLAAFVPVVSLSECAVEIVG